MQKIQVFLSHNNADKAAVEVLALRLRQETDIEPWLDTWNLIPGQPWQQEIERAIAQCKACAVFIGKGDPSKGVIGPWQNAEMRALIDRQVNERANDFPVIPVLLPNTERPQRSTLPAFLVGNTWAEFRHSLDEPEAIRRLLCGIRGHPPGPPSEGRITLGECPYRGLEFFDVAHADRFFGREAVTQWLVDDIRKPLRPGSELPRFLAILGASGSGKSSLARAGLYAALQGGAIEGSRDWGFVLPLRPGPNPLESLELAVLRAADASPQRGVVRDELRELADRPDRLHRAARLLAPDTSPPCRLFLLVDQFEEIFTHCEQPERCNAFVATLLHAARERSGPVVVVLTMRADFYSRLVAYEELARVVGQHQYLVGPMNEAELRRAIEEPAARAGAEFEPGLVDKLLEDVRSQPGALPLLQHALRELWNKRKDGGPLTHAAYKDIGGLEGALERRANEVFQQFNPPDQELCRRLFLRLVHPGEETEDTKRRVQLHELLALGDGPRIQRLIETLAAPSARLAVMEGGSKEHPEEPFVEVAHETLVRCWSKLREWLEADRAGLRTQHRLMQAARDWEAAGRPKDASALYIGAKLATAREWSATHPGEITTLEQEFLETSTQFERDEQAEKLKKARRQFRIAAALAAIALIFGLAAGWFYRQAELNARVSRSQARALQAEQRASTDFRRPQDPRVSLLLAGMAHDLQATPLTTAVLRKMVFQSRLESDVLGRHPPQLSQASFNPDMSRVLTASWTNAYVWDARKHTGAPLTVLSRHSDSNRVAVFSLDGRLALTAGWDAKAILWDTTTWQLVQSLTGHTGSISRAGFSRDGRHALTASRDRTGRVWDVATGRELSCLTIGTNQADEVWSAAFHPDGELTALGDRGGTVSLWAWRTTNRLASARAQRAEVLDLKFSTNGFLASAGADGTVVVWQLIANNLQSVWRKQVTTRGVRGVAFSPDGHLVAAATDDGTVTLQAWSADSELFTLKHPDSVTSVEFTPDGRHLLTACNDGFVRIWETVVRVIPGFPELARARVRWAEISPTGEFLVTGNGSNSVHVWNLSASRSVTNLTAGLQTVRAAAFHPVTNLLATAGDDGVLRVWDTTTWDLAATVTNYWLPPDPSRTTAMRGLAFSPDGTHLVSTADGRADVWSRSARTWAKVASLTNHTEWVTDAAFSADGRWLATASEDYWVRVWDTRSWVVRGNLAHKANVYAVAFDPRDSSRLVTGDKDLRLWRWDAPSTNWLEDGTSCPYESNLSSLQFTASGECLLATSWDGQVHVWDVDARRLIADLSMPGATFPPARRQGAVALFAPDGRSLFVFTSVALVHESLAWAPLETLLGDVKRRLLRPLTRAELAF